MARAQRVVLYLNIDNEDTAPMETHNINLNINSTDIYESASNIFKLDTFREKEEQLARLTILIKNALEAKEDFKILDAIDTARKHNEDNIIMQIERLTNELVNINYYNDGGMRSDLFIIPFIILSEGNPLTLPALKEIESVWRDNLYEQGLIDEREEFNLAPMLLGQKTSQKMEMSRWYELHRAADLNLDKRDARQMFSSAFSIQLALNQPVLSFLVATVNRDNGGSLPFVRFLNANQATQQKLEQATQAVTDKLNEGDINAVWSFYNPSTVSYGLPLAYQAHQDAVLETYVSFYANNPEIHLVFLTLDYPHTFALLAWKENTNNVLDVLVVEPFNKTMEENSAFAMSLVEGTNAQKVFFGQDAVELKSLENYNAFDFMAYRKKHDVSVLETTQENLE
jgi:hypothetical protein